MAAGRYPFPAPSPKLPAPSGRTCLRLYDERWDLSAARRDVGQAGRAKTCQVAGQPAAEDVGREIDEHVALRGSIRAERRRVGPADREQLAANCDPALGHPAAIALGEGARD